MYTRQMSQREKSIRARYGVGIVISSLCAITLAVSYYNGKGDAQKMQTEIQKLNSVVDSLRDENFNISVENGRYELSLEHLKEVDPAAGKKFEDFYDHETV